MSEGSIYYDNTIIYMKIIFPPYRGVHTYDKILSAYTNIPNFIIIQLPIIIEYSC